MKIGNIDLEEFKSGKIAVNCVSEEDAREFLKGLVLNGICWIHGREITSTGWDERKEKTCYVYYEDEGLALSLIEIQERKIIKYEGAKEMKFSDLKDNWVVMLRCNRFAVCGNSVNGFSVQPHEVPSLQEYKDDLSHKRFKHNDIMRVWDTDSGYANLVYERKEPTEKELAMKQIAEMEEKLAELKKSVEGME